MDILTALKLLSSGLGCCSIYIVQHTEGRISILPTIAQTSNMLAKQKLKLFPIYPSTLTRQEVHPSQNMP